MPDAIERIEQIEREAADSIASASGTAELEELRVRFLGRKAELTTILRGIAELPAEQRGAVGKSGNEVRGKLEQLLESRATELDSEEISSRLVDDTVDVTLPGAPAPPVGHLHLITRTRRRIEDIMVGLGYRVLEGPEVELDYYNFTALNHPPGHPARMTQDTFYVAPGSISGAALEGARTAADGAAANGAATPDEELVVLRTHTSPMQVRAMEAQGPPIFVIVPGKVYRRDSDATHSPMFHQIEGLAVAEDITLADLAGHAAGDAPRHLRRGARGANAPPLLPVHRAQRRVRRLLLRLRRLRARCRTARAAGSARESAGSRSAAPAWSTPTCSASCARTDTTPSECRASRSASAWSGSRCCATAFPTCAVSSTNDVRMLEQFT